MCVLCMRQTLTPKNTIEADGKFGGKSCWCENCAPPPPLCVHSFALCNSVLPARLLQCARANGHFNGASGGRSSPTATANKRIQLCISLALTRQKRAPSARARLSSAQCAPVLSIANTMGALAPLLAADGRVGRRRRHRSRRNRNFEAQTQLKSIGIFPIVLFAHCSLTHLD